MIKRNLIIITSKDEVLDQRSSLMKKIVAALKPTILVPGLLTYKETIELKLKLSKEKDPIKRDEINARLAESYRLGLGFQLY